MIEHTNNTDDKQSTTKQNSPAKPQMSRQKKAYPTKQGTVYLTDNQKEYADLKSARPKDSLVTIAAEAYPNANYDSLRQIVNKNEQNTNIALYSDEQVAVARNTVYEIASNKESKDRDRLAASFDILDRNLGRAIQRTEQVNNGVQLVINLTGEVTD